MKKILLSVMAIGAAAATIGLGTAAYFSDSEEVLNNSFTTGTIDIAVDGQNPWTSSNTLTVTDMKPGQHEYTEFVVRNVGSNPANVWKNLNFHTWSNEPVSEPECGAEEGNWTPSPTGPYLGSCSEHPAIDDLENVLVYDMKVGVYSEDPTGHPEMTPLWYQTIYADSQLTDVGSVYPVESGHGVYLGMVPAGYYMKVTQSYWMDPTAGNAYQGDSMQYDVNLYAEQLTGTVYLENKSAADDLYLVQHDTTLGTFSYTVKDRTFKYSFTGVAPLANTQYYLIKYAEPFGATQLTLGTAMSDASGNISIPETEMNLNANLTNAKIWLVTDADYNQTTSTMAGWHPDNYLFESGLMDYYDSLID